MYFNVGLQ